MRCTKRHERTAWGAALVFLAASHAARFWPWDFFGDARNLWKFVCTDLIPIRFDLRRIAPLLGTTVCLAVSTAFLSFVLAFLAAVLTSERLSPCPPLRLLRLVFTVNRCIPEAVLAFILFSTLGIGVKSAYAALVLTTTAFLARTFQTLIDQVDARALESVEAAGGTMLHKLVYAVLPAISREVFLWFLYYIETNIRSSALIGMVGGGGIGLLLYYDLKTFQYGSAAGVLISIFLLLFLCGELRRRIERALRSRGGASAGPAAFACALAGFVLATLRLPIGIGSFRLLENAPRFLAQLFTFENVDFAGVFRDLGYTCSLALLSTCYSAAAGMFLAFLAYSAKGLRFITELVTTAVRTIPSAIWVLFTLICFGFGSRSAVVGMCFHGSCYLYKAFMELFDNVSRDVTDALRSCGASPFQVFRFGIFPSVKSRAVQWFLYRLEMDFSTSSILGIVGAGGIGSNILFSMNSYHYGQAGFSILCIVACAWALEQLDARAAKKRIGAHGSGRR